MKFYPALQVPTMPSGLPSPKALVITCYRDLAVRLKNQDVGTVHISTAYVSTTFTEATGCSKAIMFSAVKRIFMLVDYSVEKDLTGEDALHSRLQKPSRGRK